MIIRYRRFLNFQGESSNLTLNKEYLVLGLTIWDSPHEKKINEVHLQDDEEDTPALYNLASFDIVDNRLPPDWSLRYISNSYSLDPIEFTGDFWDLYHDGDPEANQIYEEVINKIKRFHGIEVPVPLIDLDVMYQDLEDGLLSEEYLSHLKRYLTGEDSGYLGSALGLVHDFCIKELSSYVEDLLNYPSEKIRKLAIECLLNRFEAWELADKVYELLKDEDKLVRSTALLSLGKYIDRLEGDKIKQKVARFILKMASSNNADSWSKRDANVIINTNINSPNLSEQERFEMFENKYIPVK